MENSNTEEPKCSTEFGFMYSGWHSTLTSLEEPQEVKTQPVNEVRPRSLRNSVISTLKRYSVTFEKPPKIEKTETLKSIKDQKSKQRPRSLISRFSAKNRPPVSISTPKTNPGSSKPHAKISMS